MKILNVMLGAGKGGIEQVFVDYSNALSQNHDLTVICYKKCQYIDVLRENNININIVDNKCIHSMFTYLKVRNLVRKINPDIVFLHGNRAIDLFCNFFVKSAVKSTCKFIATAHNYRNKRFKKLDKAIAITKDLQDDLVSKYLDKDNVFYCPNTTNVKDEKDFSFKNHVIIGTIGRLHYVKGIDVLLKSAKILKDNNIDFKIKIAGCGPEKENLKQLALDLELNDCVEFLGWIKNKEDFFNKIDIFVLPSRSEAFGLSLIEAMAETTPTIISDCSGPVEIASINNSSIVVEKENSKALSDAIISLIESHEKAESLAKLGYKTVKENFSEKYLIECLENIIKKAVN